MQKTQHVSSSSDADADTARTPEPTDAPTPADSTGHREYDRSGLYPAGGGKAFRIWALLGGLVVVIVLLAGISALLNILLLD